MGLAAAMAAYRIKLAAAPASLTNLPEMGDIGDLPDTGKTYFRLALASHGILAITADHGNAELKIDPDNHPLTAHTQSPVPLILAGADGVSGLRDGGKLGDIASTLLPLVGLRPSPQMGGDDLTS